MSDTLGKKDGIILIDYVDILTGSMLMSTSVTGGLVSAMIESLRTLRRSKRIRESKPTDRENLSELIKTGKEQGVSEMKIEMDKSTAVGINLGELQKEVGTNVTLGVKTENRVVLEVEYK